MAMASSNFFSFWQSNMIPFISKQPLEEWVPHKVGNRWPYLPILYSIRAMLHPLPFVLFLNLAFFSDPVFAGAPPYFWSDFVSTWLALTQISKFSSLRIEFMYSELQVLESSQFCQEVWYSFLGGHSQQAVGYCRYWVNEWKTCGNRRHISLISEQRRLQEEKFKENVSFITKMSNHFFFFNFPK